VTRFHIFFIRAIVGLGFAVVLTRFFYGRVNIFMVLALAIFMVGMSYVTAYMRKRREMKESTPDTPENS
jgi:hypothetical protein